MYNTDKTYLTRHAVVQDHQVYVTYHQVWVSHQDFVTRIIKTSLSLLQTLLGVMNIKQNVMIHTKITHDKFHTKKIQNGRQLANLIIIFKIFF